MISFDLVFRFVFYFCVLKKDCDFDFTRVGRHVGFRPVNFKDCDFSEEPETDGDLVDRMCKAAIKKYNDDKVC